MFEMDEFMDFEEVEIAINEICGEDIEEGKPMKKMDGITILNDGNPITIGEADGHLFTVSPSTAKKYRAYYTDKPVKLTTAEKKMPGVVVGQNRGMLFSSSRPVSGDYIIPSIQDMNIIIVPEKSRKLYPTDDDENKIFWMGDGEHTVKDVVSDGTGMHSFCDIHDRLAFDLWLKLAKLGYGTKGMLMPCLATDIGKKVIDRWGVERTITKGNTLILNESLVKGVGAYASVEEFKAHAEEWGLTTLQKQWQSGDHPVEKKRNMGVQAMGTNLELTQDEISEMLKPEARDIWMSKFELISWMRAANVRTSRGRAFTARPELMYHPLVMEQMNTKATNQFLSIAQGKPKVKAQYLKMFPDRLAFSLVYIDGMAINEAAKKAAATGLHGELRVNPAFAGRRVKKDEDGNITVTYKEQTYLDAKGRYVEVAMVRYPHGAPSETIVVKVYLDATVPEDVIVFPLPVANDDGTIPLRVLYAFRLQGADFDGDAVTAFTEKVFVDAQKRCTGKSYMIIPVNTESTEKDKTLVKDDDDDTDDDRVKWTAFCQMKVDSLSNEVGLIATSLKYFMSQMADSLRNGDNPERDKKVISEHAQAMGDDIDEYKHGKAKRTLVPFVVNNGEKDISLYKPYFVRYSCKFKSAEDFNKAVYNSLGYERQPGKGTLDMCAVEAESLMRRCGLPITAVVTKATDGKDRFYFAVKPVTWAAKKVDLFAAGHGEGAKNVPLSEELEKLYGVEHGTTFTAKTLFQLLYRDHAANIKSLMAGATCEEDTDALVNAISRINERYALAKVAIISWTKAMAKSKDGKDITAEEALVLFTTLMTQHLKNTRSVIDVLTEVGQFSRNDGTTYEKSTFNALRALNYFLDLCGDGLLLTKVEEPKFPEVSESVMAVAGLKAPDVEKAKENARKELDIIEKLVALLPAGIEEVQEELSREELHALMNDGSMEFSSQDEYIPGDDEYTMADVLASCY